jgi:hypothetical protein
LAGTKIQAVESDYDDEHHWLEFAEWTGETYTAVLPKSPIGKACAYTLNHWAALARRLS